MKPLERDELLGRLSERTENIWRSVDKIEKHLYKLNDSVANNTKGVAVHQSSIKRLWWIVGGIGITLLGLLGTGIISIIR